MSRPNPIKEHIQSMIHDRSVGDTQENSNQNAKQGFGLEPQNKFENFSKYLMLRLLTVIYNQQWAVNYISINTFDVHLWFIFIMFWPFYFNYRMVYLTVWILVTHYRMEALLVEDQAVEIQEEVSVVYQEHQGQIKFP